MIGSLSRLQAPVPRYKSRGYQLPVGFTNVQSVLFAHFSPSLATNCFSLLYLSAFQFNYCIIITTREQETGQACATKSSKDMRYAAAFTTGTPLIHVNGMVNKAILSRRSWFWWDLPVPLMPQGARPSDHHQISNLAEVAHGTTLATQAPAIIHPLAADEEDDHDSSYIQTSLHGRKTSMRTLVEHSVSAPKKSESKPAVRRAWIHVTCSHNCPRSDK